MQIKTLRSYNLPDYSDYVVHFTGRSGGRMNDVPADITDRKDWDRLAIITTYGLIRAFPTFGNPAPVVCFTESTPTALRSVIGERYTACGIGFDKNVVFRAGGGPCFYVRGDDWEYVDGLPPSMRPFCTRYWPGANPDPDAWPWLPPWLASESQWTHEREWRVPGAGDPLGFRFTWDQIAFLITPHPDWQPFIANWISQMAGPQYEAPFMALRCVVLGPGGDVISDPGGVFA